MVNVLLYESGTENEGIHSLEINGITLVLMFEDVDDAERYCVLLEAQDFPRPTVEQIERDEIECFCEQAGYEPKFVERGFIPQSKEDKLLLVPPESNLDISKWKDDKQNDEGIISSSSDSTSSDIDQLEEIRKRLEGLL